MKRLDLDYAVAAQPYPFLMRLALLLLAIAFASMLALRYQALQATLADAQGRAGLHARQQKPAANSAELDQAMAYAIETQRSLAYPWLQLFSRLESIKQSHPNVDFLNLVPNKAKSEMRLEGEAKSFDEITHLLNDLKSDAEFKDAVLVNQYLVEPDTLAENNGKPLYTFSLVLKWWPK